MIKKRAKGDQTLYKTQYGQSLWSFADDTTIFVLLDNPGISADILNNDLKKMNGQNNGLCSSVHPKLQAMTISLKHNPNHPSYEFDSTVFDEV